MCKDCENCKYEEEEIDIDDLLDLWREKEFGTKDPTGSELVETLKSISCDGL